MRSVTIHGYLHCPCSLWQEKRPSHNAGITQCQRSLQTSLQQAELIQSPFLPLLHSYSDPHSPESQLCAGSLDTLQCIHLICSQTSLQCVSWKANIFLKRHGREGERPLIYFFFSAFFIYYFELSSNLFPTLFLLSLTPIKHANPRWLTWQGVNTGGKSWSLGGRAETLRQGIGTTSNTFPEHRHARCLCHPPARLGWPASSRLHTPTCKREPAQGKVHLEGKASSPQRRWEEDRGSCEIPWLCFKKEVFWTQPDLGV